jgi:hypothetical protein
MRWLRSPLVPPPRQHGDTRIIPPKNRHGLGGSEVFAALPVAGNVGNEPDGRRSEPVRFVGDERSSVAVSGWTIRHPLISCPFLQSGHVVASAQNGQRMSGTLERSAVPGVGDQNHLKGVTGGRHQLATAQESPQHPPLPSQLPVLRSARAFPLSSLGQLSSCLSNTAATLDANGVFEPIARYALLPSFHIQWCGPVVSVADPAIRGSSRLRDGPRVGGRRSTYKRTDPVPVIEE